MKEGKANLLNLLPTFIIKASRSSTEFEIFFSIGARINPIKIEPPTQIQAARRWIQIIIPSNKIITIKIHLHDINYLRNYTSAISTETF